MMRRLSTPGPRQSIPRAWRWARRLALFGAIIVLAGVPLLMVFSSLGDRWLPGGDLEIGSAPTASVALTADERAYYDYIAPRLTALLTETRALLQLGTEKNRNLLAFQARGRALNDLIEDLDAYVAAHPPPPRFAAMLPDYQQGANLAQRGMIESQAGFLRFDWDRVARAVRLFEAGVTALEQSERSLVTAAGVPTESRGSPAARAMASAVVGN